MSLSSGGRSAAGSSSRRHLDDWDALDLEKHADEPSRVADLVKSPAFDEAFRAGARASAVHIIERARAAARRRPLADRFLDAFGLSTEEGLAFLGLAEALLRTPDRAAMDALIEEKLLAATWRHPDDSARHWLVRLGALGLSAGADVLAAPAAARGDVAHAAAQALKTAGAPVIRAALLQAMRLLGDRYVLGETIDAALARSSAIRTQAQTCFSYDMLGEGARTDVDAQRYWRAYADAIDAVGARNARNGASDPVAGDGVSVKLSALHPRFEARGFDHMSYSLFGTLYTLAVQAKAAKIGLTIDAEEADRLVPTLKLVARLMRAPELDGWSGLGVAVQAYQKRARSALVRLHHLARATGRRLTVRLVKGAYWDGEIKHAQAHGRPDYPVWTQKAASDAHYLACADDLLRGADWLYPQFATHNALTAVSVARLAAARGVTAFEFQRLHGMGEAFYAAADFGARLRVYAPVGAHADLLPYLVRRLLENGANASFVSAFLDPAIAPDRVAEDPIDILHRSPGRHPRIPRPPELFGAARRNAVSRDLAAAADRAALAAALQRLDASLLIAAPIVSGETSGLEADDVREVRSPNNPARIVGRTRDATRRELADALQAARRAQPAWDARGGGERALILRAVADQFETRFDDFVALIAREAGRTLQDGVDEVREAIDFCRYYAQDAERLFGLARDMPAIAGETNRLTLHGRGVFACISPWNFPLAIFTGQIAAALAAGNSVLAKPAEQTPLVAAEAVHAFHRAGIPSDVLHFLPGDREEIGAALVADPHIAGVAFTGSCATAKAIERILADRDGAVGVLIAETGGLNAMIVDATALTEQVVDDVIASAFGSAGQRCSALRLLLLPHSAADKTIAMLRGALDLLVVGDPAMPETDIGPLIDVSAKARIERHLQRMQRDARILDRADIGAKADAFQAPTIVEIDDLALLKEEVFGPVLHVLRYDPDMLDQCLAQIAAKGFGLTLGVHSRLRGFADRVIARLPAGNVYVNRSMIGAAVGQQPFGGVGLSGTGPKAGGPHYLLRFATERVVTVNTAAQGGDISLLSL